MTGPGGPGDGGPGEDRLSGGGGSGEVRPVGDDGSGGAVARALVAALTARGLTLAVAESLTGGAVAAAVVDVPGASRCLRGGVVAYATDLKATLLGVPTALLEAHGAVHPDVARAMARGVRERLGSSYGLATTGVGGPDPQDGHPPGTFHVAVAGPGGVDVVTTTPTPGGTPSRADVRAAAVDVALRLALRRVGDDASPAG